MATIGYQNGTSSFSLSGSLNTNQVLTATGQLLSGPAVGDVTMVLSALGESNATMLYSDDYNTDLELTGTITTHNGPGGAIVFEFTGSGSGYVHPNFEGPVSLSCMMDGCSPIP